MKPDKLPNKLWQAVLYGGAIALGSTIISLVVNRFVFNQSGGGVHQITARSYGNLPPVCYFPSSCSVLVTENVEG